MDEQMEALREAQAKRSCERYATRLAAGRGGVRRDGDVAAQAGNYAAAQLMISRLRADTAEVLDRFGVATIVRPYYYSFVLALAKRDRELWTEFQRWSEGRPLVTLWVARGLRREVLLEVARGVLGLDLSGSKPPAWPGVRLAV